MPIFKGVMVGLVAAFAVMMGGGCTHLTMLRTEELRRVRSHVDSLGVQLSTTQQDLLRQQKEHHELLRLIRADQQVRFSELEMKISNLEGNLTENQQRLTAIDQKTQEIKRRWEEAARSDSVSDALRTSEMTKLFQVAHDDFMARRFDLAVSGFRDIRTQYPGTPLAETATYWIAETFYAQNQLDKADEAYKEYLKEFPDGKHVCPTLFKMGKIYQRQKKDRSREMVWGRLIERCPQSEEAKAAREQMKSR